MSALTEIEKMDRAVNDAAKSLTGSKFDVSSEPGASRRHFQEFKDEVAAACPMLDRAGVLRVADAKTPKSEAATLTRSGASADLHDKALRRLLILVTEGLAKTTVLSHETGAGALAELSELSGFTSGSRGVRERAKPHPFGITCRIAIRLRELVSVDDS